MTELVEEAHAFRRVAGEGRRQFSLARFIFQAITQESGQWHDLEALLQLDSGANVLLVVGKDAQADNTALGTDRYLGHFPRYSAAKIRAGDQVIARLRALDTTDIETDFIEHIAKLHQVPTRLGQRGHMHDQRLLRYIEARIAVDGDVVGRHDRAVFSGFQRVVLAQGIETHRACLQRLQPGNIVVIQRIAP
ncbi:hypothetical protein D9M71_623850 [compost metagenome]